jgi:YVTN family beta-propeller protein
MGSFERFKEVRMKACASTNDVNVIDTGAATVISKVPVEQGPDGVGYLAQK